MSRKVKSNGSLREPQARQPVSEEHGKTGRRDKRGQDQEDPKYHARNLALFFGRKGEALKAFSGRVGIYVL